MPKVSFASTKNNIGITALVLVTLLGSSQVQAGDKHDHHAASPTFKTTEVTKNITMLQGKGGNIAILKGEQGLLMIDDDYKAMSTSLMQTLETFGGKEQLAYIINTHWHGDHTEGNLALGKYSPIIAHDNVRKRLLSAQEIKLFNMRSEPYPKHALPSITYSKSLTLHINDETVELKHFANGHTDGDSVVFFKNANTVHMGDHFFNGIYPFVDIEHGGNVLGMAKNIDAILKEMKNDTKIIPGHGPLGNKKDLKAFHDMLVGTSQEVKNFNDKSLSLEEIQTQGLSKQWTSWSNGFLSEKVWISIVYNSLYQ